MIGGWEGNADYLNASFCFKAFMKLYTYIYTKMYKLIHVYINKSSMPTFPAAHAEWYAIARKYSLEIPW